MNKNIFPSSVVIFKFFGYLNTGLFIGVGIREVFIEDGLFSVLAMMAFVILTAYFEFKEYSLSRSRYAKDKEVRS